MQKVQCSIFNCSSSLNSGSSTDNFLHLNYNLKQNESQSARADSNKGANLRTKDVTHTQQQRPEWLTGTVTWHACKYKVHKLLVGSLHRPTFCTYSLENVHYYFCPQKVHPETAQGFSSCRPNITCDENPGKDYEVLQSFCC